MQYNWRCWSVIGSSGSFRTSRRAWAVIMLGMGVTLTFDDFKRVLKAPRPIATGCGAQFLIMPFLGCAIAHALNLQAIA